MNKKVIIPTLALGALALVGAYGIKSVDAQGGPGWGGQNQDSLIQRLVDRFNLNRDEVQQVFDEQRQQNQDQMKAKQEERLNQLVQDGKLTEDQKQKLIAKMEEERQERQQDMENWQNMTQEQRREQMQEHQQEMHDWAEQNGIDLPMLGGFGKGMDMHRGGGFGVRNQAD